MFDEIWVWPLWRSKRKIFDIVQQPELYVVGSVLRIIILLKPKVIFQIQILCTLLQILFNTFRQHIWFNVESINVNRLTPFIATHPQIITLSLLCLTVGRKFCFSKAETCFLYISLLLPLMPKIQNLLSSENISFY